METIFSLPVKMHTGEYLSFEEVTSRLESDTVGYFCNFGFKRDGISWCVLRDILTVEIQVASTEYEKAVSWMRNLLYNSEFSIER